MTSTRPTAAEMRSFASLIEPYGEREPTILERETIAHALRCAAEDAERAREMREALTDEWPEGISDGLTLPCGICGRVPSMDYTVRDDFWASVVPKRLRLGVVCLDCLADLALARGLGVAGNVTQVQWVGQGETLVLTPIHVYRYADWLPTTESGGTP